MLFRWQSLGKSIAKHIFALICWIYVMQPVTMFSIPNMGEI